MAAQGIYPGMTVGVDRGYKTLEFVELCRTLKISPHVAAKDSGGSVDGRTTRTPGYGISQIVRKWIA